MIPSKGHIAYYKGDFFPTFELYLDARGEVHRAPVGNALDCITGYRIGRWEGPAWMLPHILKTHAEYRVQE